MALSCDFDMFDVFPTEGEDDPVLGKFMTEIGFRPDAATRKVALFRDARTADALQDAPEGLRNFFLASGFGLNTFQSGAPAGFYPEQDEEARLDVIRRLTENAEVFSLPRLDQATETSEFSLTAFLTALAAAQPMAMVARPSIDVGGDAADMLAQDDDEIDLSPAFDQGDRPAEVPHDLRHPSEVQPKVMPPIFETMPPEAPKTRKKFWQGKFFFLSIFVASLVCAEQGASHLVALV